LSKTSAKAPDSVNRAGIFRPGGRREKQNSRNGLPRRQGPTLEAFDVGAGYGQIAAWRAMMHRNRLIVPHLLQASHILRHGRT
jgi:hypothetical protein